MLLPSPLNPDHVFQVECSSGPRVSGCNTGPSISAVQAPEFCRTSSGAVMSPHGARGWARKRTAAHDAYTAADGVTVLDPE